LRGEQTPETKGGTKSPQKKIRSPSRRAPWKEKKTTEGGFPSREQGKYTGTFLRKRGERTERSARAVPFRSPGKRSFAPQKGEWGQEEKSLARAKRRGGPAPLGGKRKTRTDACRAKKQPAAGRLLRRKEKKKAFCEQGEKGTNQTGGNTHFLVRKELASVAPGAGCRSHGGKETSIGGGVPLRLIRKGKRTLPSFFLGGGPSLKKRETTRRSGKGTRFFSGKEKKKTDSGEPKKGANAL